MNEEWSEEMEQGKRGRRGSGKGNTRRKRKVSYGDRERRGEIRKTGRVRERKREMGEEKERS